jgi:hypothetical protein
MFNQTFDGATPRVLTAVIKLSACDAPSFGIGEDDLH